MLGNALRDSPFLLISGDQRIRTDARASFRYADVTVVCDEPQYSEDRPASLLNPTVIFEVLSDTTEVTDRKDKLNEYRSIPSLQAYVLVSQHTERVEYYLRDAERSAWWYDDAATPDASFDLPAVGCKVELSEVYFLGGGTPRLRRHVL